MKDQSWLISDSLIWSIHQEQCFSCMLRTDLWNLSKMQRRDLWPTWYLWCSTLIVNTWRHSDLHFCCFSCFRWLILKMSLFTKHSNSEATFWHQRMICSISHWFHQTLCARSACEVNQFNFNQWELILRKKMFWTKRRKVMWLSDSIIFFVPLISLDIWNDNASECWSIWFPWLQQMHLKLKVEMLLLVSGGKWEKS
jgi:hypothetical protein